MPDVAPVDELAPAGVAVAPAPVLRRVLGVLGVGGLLVVLTVFSDPLFELDRFIAPKEFVLHATALAALVLVVRRVPRLGATWLDAVLVGVLALGAVSTVLAPNPWLGLRALAVSASATALFWVGRALARDGLGRAAAWIAAAGILAFAATALAQAYGVPSDYFSLRRAPGGTLGNRNSAAHLAAIGLPLVAALGLSARRRVEALVAGPALGALVAVLVLTRSRAGWVAALATVAVAAAGYALRRGRWELPRVRLGLLALGFVGGLAVATALPNALRWKSDSPYLDTATGIVNYREGSGAGRLVQYRQTARMALDAPVLGVGPGNWPTVYPRYAVRRDPSLNGSGMTANAWPSSDAFALLAERGLPAVLGLVVAFGALLLSSLARVRRVGTSEAAFEALGRAGVLVAALVAGLFDAVLLLPGPALLVPLAVGALAPAVRLPPLDTAVPVRRRLRLVVLVLGGLCVAQSGARAGAMLLAASTDARMAQEVAVALDPGGYRIRMRLAERYARRRECSFVERHAGAAHRYYPEAYLPTRLLRRCGVR